MFNTFYHGTLRKYVILFGTLMNDIYINRIDGNGETVQTIKVPITYGPKDKTISKIQGDPDNKRPVAIVLPRMSFEMIGIDYDPSRKLNTVQKYVSKDPKSNQVLYQYAPVPYNITFDFNIYVKNADDGTRIIEQILPYFTPEWTTTVNLIPELNESVDIPLIINSVTLADNYEGSFEERRVLIWNMSFVMKGFLYGPTNKSGGKNGRGGLITLANTNFYIPTTNTASEGVGVTAVSENITVTPGLTANGEPTSNSELTIDRNSINPEDDYGFIVDFMGINNE